MERCDIRSDLFHTMRQAVPMPAALQRSSTLVVLGAGALGGILKELAPQFEQRMRRQISVAYERSGVVSARVLEGDIVDVVITIEEHISELARRQKIVPESIAAVAGSRIGVAVRAGADRPNIGSVAAFKETLLNSRSIAYADPATGSPSGNHFVRVMDRLGIAADMASKSRRIGPSENSVVVVCDAVAGGQVELGIQQISEILAVPGVELLGALPPELQQLTVFSAAIVTGASNLELARLFVDYITSEEVLPVKQRKGMERVI
jgi:molybdate transport system substrate-binding protein